MTTGRPRPKLRNELLFEDSLNLFIDENCHSGFTCMDIDLYCVKVKDKRIRFIESKRMGERMSYGQSIGVKLLGGLSHFDPSFTVEAYIVFGDYPFADGAIVQKVLGNTHNLNRQQLIEWLDFRRELE